MRYLLLPLFIILTCCGGKRVPGVEEDIKDEQKRMDSINFAKDKEFYSKYPPSKSMILKCVISNRILSSGTCFIVAYKGNKYLITNWHNLTGKEVSGETKNEIPENLIIDTKDNVDGRDKRVQISTQQPWSQFIDKNGSLLDIAILDLTPDINANTVIYNIDEVPATTLVEDSCYIVGFPKSYAESKNNNRYPIVIGAKRTTHTEINKLLPNSSLIIWYDKIENGTSGSPVLSKNGSLLGLYYYKLTDPRDRSNYGAYYNIEIIRMAIEGCKPIDWDKIK